MDFYHRQARGDNGIPKANGGVGEPSRIQEHYIRIASACIVQGINKRALVIGLHSAQVNTTLLRSLREGFVELL